MFKDYGLAVVVDADLKKVDFLDVTFDREKNLHRSFRKPNNCLNHIYVRENSNNHPPDILAAGIISKRTLETSYSETVFNKSIKTYSKALKESGFTNNHQMKHDDLKMAKKGNAEERQFGSIHPIQKT